MNTEAELPDDVIAEIQANRKVTAIKMLRVHKGIGLKEAKELVDAYADSNPPTAGHQMPRTDSGLGRIAILILGVAVIFVIYRYFT